MAADRFQRGQKQLPAVDVDPLDDSLQRRLGLDQVAILAGELLEAGFELLQFVERFEVDGADVVDLVAQLGDFALDRFAIRGWELRAGRWQSSWSSLSLAALPAASPGRCRSRPASARRASAARGAAGRWRLPACAAGIAARSAAGAASRTRSITCCRLRRSSSSAAVCLANCSQHAAPCAGTIRQAFAGRRASRRRARRSASRGRQAARASRPAFARVPAGCARPAPSAAQHFDALLALGDARFAVRSRRPAIRACCCLQCRDAVRGWSASAASSSSAAVVGSWSARGRLLRFRACAGADTARRSRMSSSQPRDARRRFDRAAPAEAVACRWQSASFAGGGRIRRDR